MPTDANSDSFDLSSLGGFGGLDLSPSGPVDNGVNSGGLDSGFTFTSDPFANMGDISLSPGFSGLDLSPTAPPADISLDGLFTSVPGWTNYLTAMFDNPNGPQPIPSTVDTNSIPYVNVPKYGPSTLSKILSGIGKGLGAISGGGGSSSSIGRYQSVSNTQALRDLQRYETSQFVQTQAQQSAANQSMMMWLLLGAAGLLTIALLAGRKK